VSVASVGDGGILARLRAGDEAAFCALVQRHHRPMKRVAMMYVSSEAVAEEVLQETWMAVIRGLASFEERSSLKTWIFRILVNRARSKAVRESRTVPFSSLVSPDGDDGPTVGPERFQGPGGLAPGYWTTVPARFFELPEDQIVSAETRALIEATIAALPARQQQVIRLRDIEGWDPLEVCQALEISDGNQRILLHRARARVRSVLETHFADTTPR
jgi:RNA polymerase sigma-70 factor (ECF subfamily)